MREGSTELAGAATPAQDAPGDATVPSPPEPSKGSGAAGARPGEDAGAEAPGAARASRRSDLMQRLATAGVLIPVVLWVIVQGGLLYLAVVMGIGLIAQHELYGLIEDKGARPIRSIGLGFGAAVMFVAYFGSEYHAMLLMTASLLALMVAQLGKNEISEAMASLSGTFFGVFYVAWLLSHAVLLRRFDEVAGGHHDPAWLATYGLAPGCGIFLMIFTLVVIVACDAGAYFAGRAWGRRKLAPKISPNKSVEGALGGLIAGVAGGMVAKLAFDSFWPDLSALLGWSPAMLFAVILCGFGVVGDLVESLLKRDADVKDTGALLPGMGGVLDRIDAPLLGLPGMYYLMLGYLFFLSA